MYRTSNFSVDSGAFVGKVKVKKGRTTFVNWGCYIDKNVELGAGVLMGPNVTIVSASHGTVKGVHVKNQKVVHKKIIIEDGVWIGAGATILGGNVIKQGAIIGAGSVLTEDHVVGEDEIWVGNPCKLLRHK